MVAQWSACASVFIVTSQRFFLLFLLFLFKVVIIEPDHGFLKPQQNVLLKVGAIIFIDLVVC